MHYANNLLWFFFLLLLLFFEILHDRKNETRQMLGTTLKALLEGIQIIQQVK